MVGAHSPDGALPSKHCARGDSSRCRGAGDEINDGAAGDGSGCCIRDLHDGLGARRHHREDLAVHFQRDRAELLSRLAGHVALAGHGGDDARDQGCDSRDSEGALAATAMSRGLFGVTPSIASRQRQLYPTSSTFSYRHTSRANGPAGVSEDDVTVAARCQPHFS